MWKLLVVDDNFVNRKLVLEMLRGRAECDVAANGKEAVEAFELSLQQGCPYDAILLDISMPDVDGLEVLDQIRAREAAQGSALGDGIPVLMLTAYKQHLNRAFGRGCDDYILKPVRADVLLEKLAEKIAVKRHQP